MKKTNKIACFFSFLIFLTIFFVFPLQSANLKIPADKHLILHFDVNKTIIAFDQVQNNNTEDVLNILLAERYKYQWDESCKEPISYKDYLKKQHLTEQEINFQKTRFLAFLGKTNNQLKEKVQSDYEQLLSSLHPKASQKIFSSFYRLLEELEKEHVRYTIILRTFGNDVDLVVSEINEQMGRQFFQESASFKKDVLITDQNAFIQPRDIYNYISSGTNKIIHDDYHWWNDHGQKAFYGKPVYIDPSDQTKVHIFFDDHIKKLSSKKNIVKAMNIQTDHLITEQEPAAQFLIHVDTIQAILDQDYYTKLLKKTLKMANWTGFQPATARLEGRSSIPSRH